MNKLIITAVVVVSGLFSVFADESKTTPRVLISKSIAGTVFDSSLPADTLMTLNNLGKQGKDFFAIEIAVLGDKACTVERNAQAYTLQIEDGITVSSRTLKLIPSTTSHKITRVVISRRAGKQDMSDARTYNGTW